MKTLLGLLVVLLLAACGGQNSTPSVRLKIAEIKKHGHEVVDAILKADVDEDGYISGNEWLLLGNEAVAFYVKLARN